MTVLTGEVMHIAVKCCRRLGSDTAESSVIKDGGDDPDITHGAEIGARVTLQLDDRCGEIEIVGGQGVGRVTKPGLEVAPGLAAINAGPREMIRQAVTEVLGEHRIHGRVIAEIFVPRGEALARHTLNERLGIMGGISILGTTGIVRPLSHEAYIATIQAALSVARASGAARVVLTTGRRSERFARQVWPEMLPEAFMQIGDYFEKSIQMVVAHGFHEVMLCVFFGKALKMAQSIPHTHARSARLTMKRLAQWTLAATGNPALAQQVGDANTARHAFELIAGRHPAVIERVGREMVKAAAGFANHQVKVRGIIFGFEGQKVFDSEEKMDGER